jgi:polyisoprenoid-binding protein YceI
MQGFHTFKIKGLNTAVVYYLFAGKDYVCKRYSQVSLFNQFISKTVIMKKITAAASLLWIILLFVSFKGIDKNTGIYQVDLTKSGVTWTGKKVIGGHNGTISVKEGNLNYNGNTITSGTFVIDMNTISSLDLEGEKKLKLDNHLKSPDFFDVPQYPFSTFRIKRVEKSSDDKAMAIGTLTIKAVTREIRFPITMNVKDGRIEVTAEDIAIDRTQYGVVYASRSLKSTLGDKAIDDIFKVSFSLVLLKKSQH